MTTSPVLPADLLYSQVLRLAIAAYLARFKATSRTHADSDLRAHLGWCADRGLDPLTASRPHIELYVRWMQEVRRLKPSTVSSRGALGPPRDVRPDNAEEMSGDGRTCPGTGHLSDFRGFGPAPRPCAPFTGNCSADRHGFTSVD